jgi:oxaloacetate decarboxylase (Na+ extruding) subunit gamma
MEIEPLTLMAIGMITVFTVLIFVVISGNLLTDLVNKYIPEEPKAAARVSATPPAGVMEAKKLSAIVAAVDWITKGKGKVTKIEKKK